MGLRPHYIHAYSPKRDLPCANSTLSILLHQCTFVSFLLVFKNKIARWQIKKGYKIWGRCINLQAHTLWPWVVVACGDMHGCPRAAAATLARHACFACTTMSRGVGACHSLALTHNFFLLFWSMRGNMDEKAWEKWHELSSYHARAGDDKGVRRPPHTYWHATLSILLQRLMHAAAVSLHNSTRWSSLNMLKTLTSLSLSSRVSHSIPDRLRIHHVALIVLFLNSCNAI
jgi:hypothetical protein